MTAIKGLMKRFDGFISSVTGIGTSRDKKKTVSHLMGVRPTKSQLDDYYAEQALAKRIVNLLPDDGLRKWFEVKHELNPEIQRKLKALRAKSKYRSAARKDRLHGGSAVYIDINDGQSMELPVNENYSNFEVLALRVIEIDDIEPLSGMGHTATCPDAREAEYFRMWDDQGGAFIIHRSRLSVFPGIEISDSYRHSNGGWGESVLRDCLEAIMAYGLTHGTVPTIIQDFIIGILKIAGLNEMIEADDDDTLKGRLDAAITGESYVNKLVIDSQDDYSREVANVSGLDNLIKHPERWLAACSGIPHTKLLAESAGASLGEGGKGEKQDYEEMVEAYQQDKLLEPLEKLVKYVALELKIKDDLDLVFNPLRVMTEKEQAELYNSQSQADEKYYNMGVTLPEEIRESLKSRNIPHIHFDDQMYEQELELDGITSNTPEVQA